ncbi:MAG: hypothetical protein ABIK21_04940, partial [bacterium]
RKYEIRFLICFKNNIENRKWKAFFERGKKKGGQYVLGSSSGLEKNRDTYLFEIIKWTKRIFLLENMNSDNSCTSSMIR